MRTTRLCLLLLPLAAWGAPKKPVTLADVTRPEPLARAAVTWAPDSKGFAYRERDSIFYYDVAAKTRREIVSLLPLEARSTKPTADRAFGWRNRRVAEQSFSWAANARQMLLSISGDLFLVDVSSGKWEQLTETAEPESDPKLSPDASRVAFRRGHNLYSLHIATKKVARLTNDGSESRLNGELDWVYPEELELSTAFWWSPDSSRIAYLQFDTSREPIYPQADWLAEQPRFEPERYPRAGEPNAEVRLGVVGAGGGRTRWMDTGDSQNLLARVAWLPDSTRLAVQRLNRIQNRLDLLLADARSGAVRPLLREEDPQWINVADHLRFLKDGRFLWSSERTGFRHLYVYSMDGALSQTLTRGEWEVSALAGVDEDHGLVYFTATAESPLERHLYRVGLDGSAFTRLTGPPGTHSISMSPNTGYYLDTHSSLTSPRRQTVHAADGVELAVYQEADRTPLDEYEILPTEIVPVRGAAGTLFYARLIKPAKFDPGRKYPAVIMVYGGPHAQTVRNSWPGMTWDQALAYKGFVIWQLDNRGSAGRGHKWEAVIHRRLGEQELADQKEGISHLLSLGFVDPKRIGIYGWSYGGYMTLYSLTHSPELFRAGIAGAPVTDWRNYDSIYTDRYMGLPSDNPNGYRSSSPLTNTFNLKAKLLLIHNINDDNVHFRNTLQMSQALQKAGKPFDLMVYPLKTHAVEGSYRLHFLDEMTTFLERHLK
jgi:dipeptidyl-peptidase 4